MWMLFVFQQICNLIHSVPGLNTSCYICDCSRGQQWPRGKVLEWWFTFYFTGLPSGCKSHFLADLCKSYWFVVDSTWSCSWIQSRLHTLQMSCSIKVYISECTSNVSNTRGCVSSLNIVLFLNSVKRDGKKDVPRRNFKRNSSHVFYW